MTTKYKSFFLLLLLITAVAPGCKKDFGNLNSPTEEDFLKNPTKDQLNNLVTGIESAMRNNIGLYLDDVGVIGREMYRFSTGDPRYTTDLLGASDAHLDPTGFYLTNTWASRYRVVKNCNLLIEASDASGFVSDAVAKGYAGFAKTMMAYQLFRITPKRSLQSPVCSTKHTTIYRRQKFPFRSRLAFPALTMQQD